MPSDIVTTIKVANYILNGRKAVCAPQLSPLQQTNNGCHYVYTDIITKEYVLTNLIQSNMPQSDRKDDLFYRMKHFLVLNWLKRHFSESDFFTFFLNYSYYGNGVIGINNAASKFFHSSLKNLTLAQKVYLVTLLIKNNTYIYSNPLYLNQITIPNIVNTMESFGYISQGRAREALNNIPSVSQNISNTPYQIYTNSMISAALPNTVETNKIVVKSTLSSVLENTLASLISSAISANNLESGAGMIVHQGKILAGVAPLLKNNSISYDSQYPVISISLLLKPLLYYILYAKDFHIPTGLLNKDIQNIILEQTLSPEKLNIQYFSVFAQNFSAKATSDQKAVLNKMATQLISMEVSLLSNVDASSLRELLVELRFPPNSLETTPNLIGFKATAPFNAIVNSYAIFNQGGGYYIPIFLDKVVSHKLKRPTYFSTVLSPDILHRVLITNTRETDHNSSNNKYYIVYGYNTAIVYYKDYTIGLTLKAHKESDLHGSVNSYHILEKMIPPLIESLSAIDNAVNPRRASETSAGGYPAKANSEATNLSSKNGKLDVSFDYAQHKLVLTHSTTLSPTTQQEPSLTLRPDLQSNEPATTEQKLRNSLLSESNAVTIDSHASNKKLLPVNKGGINPLTTDKENKLPQDNLLEATNSNITTATTTAPALNTQATTSLSVVAP